MESKFHINVNITSSIRCHCKSMSDCYGPKPELHRFCLNKLEVPNRSMVSDSHVPGHSNWTRSTCCLQNNFIWIFLSTFSRHKFASLPMKNTICLSLFSYTASTWVKFLGNPVHNLSISCGYPAYKPWLPIRHRYCTEGMFLLKYRTRVFV